MKHNFKELMKAEEVVGILLVGSSSMGLTASDHDYEVIVNNNFYKNMETSDKHYTVGDDEFLFISVDDFETKQKSCINVEKWRYTYAKIMYQSNKYCEEILPRICAMDLYEWEHRVLLGYFELSLICNKMKNKEMAKAELSYRGCKSFFYTGYYELVFLLNYRIPPLPYYLSLEADKFPRVKKYFQFFDPDNDESRDYCLHLLKECLLAHFKGSVNLDNFEYLASLVNSEEFRECREKFSWL
jgi:hypothetical protein